MKVLQKSLTDSTLSLEVRLAEAVGVPAGMYAFDHYYPGEYVPPTYRRQKEHKLARMAVQACEESRMTDKLGLEFAESSLFLSLVGRASSEVAYHGSPFDLHLLRPRQATWRDPNPNKLYRYADGHPALCASPSVNFPVMRALLNDVHPEVADHPMFLSKRSDAQGRSYWFTTEEVLESLHAENTRGKVYALAIQSGVGPRKPDDVQYDEKRSEYRIYSSRTPLLEVAVSVEALPPELCVIPADERAKLPLLPSYQNAREWGDSLDVPVRPLGGLWPIAFAPDY